MSRSDSPTEPPQGYAFPSNVDPPWATPPGLPGSSTDRSPRAVPNYPGEPGGCGHPLLHHRWQASSRMAAWPLSVCVTRPNRVRLRYGSRVRLRQASSGESLHRPLARLPVEWVITGQAPFSLQDQPGLSWHSIHRGFCDVCDERFQPHARQSGERGFGAPVETEQSKFAKRTWNILWNQQTLSREVGPRQGCKWVSEADRGRFELTVGP